MTELAERQVSAWGVSTHYDISCATSQALKHRLHLFSSCVVPPLIGSLAVGYSQAHNALIHRASQDKMLRRIMHVPRRPMENAESHMMRWACLERNCRSKHKLPHGVETYFGSYFSWCGHVVRENKSPVRAQKHGTASGSEQRGGYAMPRPTLQGLDVGTGSVSVCRRGMDFCKTKLLVFLLNQTF